MENRSWEEIGWSESTTFFLEIKSNNFQNKSAKKLYRNVALRKYLESAD